jgi:hypothetical protein
MANSENRENKYAQVYEAKSKQETAKQINTREKPGRRILSFPEMQQIA